MTERETEMLKTMERLVTAIHLGRQPLRLSGEVNPAEGKHGQTTATLPDGTPVERHAYLAEVTVAAEALLKQYTPVTLTLDCDEVALLIEALDSHEYWQLSDSDERNDGASTIEDGENEAIDAVRELGAKLEKARAGG